MPKSIFVTINKNYGFRDNGIQNPLYRICLWRWTSHKEVLTYKCTQLLSIDKLKNSYFLL